MIGDGGNLGNEKTCVTFDGGQKAKTTTAITNAAKFFAGMYGINRMQLVINL
jgi:hypothetical protein